MPGTGADEADVLVDRAEEIIVGNVCCEISLTLLVETHRDPLERVDGALLARFLLRK